MDLYNVLRAIFLHKYIQISYYTVAYFKKHINGFLIFVSSRKHFVVVRKYLSFVFCPCFTKITTIEYRC